jgi:hypothetical protein
MNRCRVLGGNGPITLSVPLVNGRNQKTVYKEVKIHNADNWQSRHWKTISSCYNKSPFFDHYREELEKLYAGKYTFLLDWNLECFKWIADKLSMSATWTLSESYHEHYPADTHADWRGKLKPATINEIFNEGPMYPQVFQDRFGFVPNLSILDFLFCVNAKA